MDTAASLLWKLANISDTSRWMLDWFVYVLLIQVCGGFSNRVLYQVLDSNQDQWQKSIEFEGLQSLIGQNF